MIYDNEPDELQLLLLSAFRRMTTRVRERLVAEGHRPLTVSQGSTLRYILENPDRGLPQIAAHLGVSRQAAWKVVQQLEKWRLIERRWNPDDRRYQQIRITDPGHAYVKRAVELLAEEHAEWSQALGPGRLRQLRDDLAAYVGDMNRIAELGPLW